MRDGGAGGRERVQLAAVVFAVLFAQVLLYPGIPDLVAALGATTSLDAGAWFLGAEFAAFVAFASLWGAASDAAGRRVPFVRAGAVGGAVGYLGLALLATRGDVGFGAAVAVRALQGAATIGAFSLSMTMLMDLPGGHGRNMGAAGIAIGLGTALGAPIGGALTAVGPTVPLYAAAVVLLLAGAVTTVATDRVAESDRASAREAISVLREVPSLFVPYAFGFIDRLSAGFFALVGTFYFQTAFGLDAAETGLVLALFFAPFALLQYPFGRLSDRIGRTIPVGGGSLLYGVAVIAVGLAPTLDAVRPLMFVVGVVGAFMAPATMALVTDVAPEARRGTAMGGFNIFGSLGFLAGIVAGSLVAEEYGYFEAFLAVGALEVAIAVLAVPALLRIERPAGIAPTGDPR